MTIGTAAALISFTLFSLGGTTINFDKLKPDTFPPFWTATVTGPTQASRWEVQRDSTAPSRPNVFAEEPGVGNSGLSFFSLAVFDKVVCRDGDLSVKFKISASSRTAKTAGIVWRFQDPRNYYLLNFNVDERNIALFRVQNGQLHPIPVLHGRPGDTGVSHDLRPGQWYEAKVIFRGNSFHVLFGNRELFDAWDDALPAAGKTGLWTRGGTAASFDDYRIDRKG